MSYNKVKNKITPLKSDQQISLKKSKYMYLSEKRGRDWRFRCFSRLYLAQNYTILLTGHTATDRAETAFLQLIRGTSLQGLTNFKSTKIYRSIYPKYYNYSSFLK